LRNRFLILFGLLPVFVSAQEVWRVEAADGSVYGVGRTQAEAVSQASLRYSLENGSESERPFVAVRREGAVGPDARIADETAEEILIRLRQLRDLAASNPSPAVQGVVRQTMERYADSGDKVAVLNDGLDRIVFEIALASLEASETPELDVRILAEPAPLSSFDNAPAGFRTGYVALLERIDGARPAVAATTEPSRKREQLLKSHTVPGGENRFVFEPAVSAGGVAKVRYHLISRSETQRKETVVTDVWTGKNGVYKLTSTQASPAPPLDLDAMRTRIVQEAKAELQGIHQRQERQAEEAKKAADERARQKAEAERLEKERKELEERQRQAEEDRRRQKEEYVRQFDSVQGDLDRVLRDRDDALRNLPDAQRDADSRADEARRLRQARDEAASRVRELEANLEQAKSEGKATQLMQQVLREARQQLEDKDRQYQDADRRADSARDRAEALARTARDLDSRRSQLESELARLKSLIDSLG
jgi:hypothetical protein